VVDLRKYRPKVTIECIAEKLIEAANKIYEFRISCAIGDFPPAGTLMNHGDKKAQDVILALVEPMIKNYQQTRNIEAKTTQEVVKLLQKGKVTIKESIELLKLIGTKIEVESKEMEAKMKEALLKQL